MKEYILTFLNGIFKKLCHFHFTVLGYLSKTVYWEKKCVTDDFAFKNSWYCVII